MFNQTFLVVFAQNRKVGMQTDHFGVSAQNFDADAVKSAKPNAVCHIPNQILHTFFHFFGGAVGKGDNQTIPRLSLPHCQNIGQASG